MIDAIWVYKWKVDRHEWVVKAKLRLIARGFRQCEGIDVSETFVPIVSSSCVLLLSAIACVRDLDICHFDVDQAFVRPDPKEVFFCDCRKDVTIVQERWFDSTNVCTD